MQLLPLFLLVLTFISIDVSAKPYKTLVAPINKDLGTFLYTITLNSKEHYVMDINAPFLWFVCQQPYPSIACSSPQCIQARTYLSNSCPSSNNIVKNGKCTCIVTPVNPVTKSCAPAQLTNKDFMISWTNGKNPIVGINFKHLYVSCAPKSLLQSLPKSSIGIAGLSWSPLALSTQFTPSYLGLTKKFAICLPSAPRARGVIFFGDGPYNLLPLPFDIASILSYTPLLRKKNSVEYYIGLKGISIGGKAIKLQSPSTVMKLSTIVPYTTLRSDIYNSLLTEFSRATRGYPQVKKVNPFGLCFNSTAIGSTRVGLAVPQIDLELGNGAKWTVFGANSMKQVSNEVACLAFIDGGKTAQEAVVIGSYQMENNFLLFDLAASRLGFSSSLFFFRTTCGNFNFTSGA